jgi:hypothetical protein
LTENSNSILIVMEIFKYMHFQEGVLTLIQVSVYFQLHDQQENSPSGVFAIHQPGATNTMM